MINWRKIVLQISARILRRKMFRNLKFLKMIEHETPEALNQRQEEKLIHLLTHAYMNVPYYHKILDEAGVVKDGRVYLENFQNIPLLTKSIIRREGENLYSKDYKKRSWYPNSSGGSTGEPVCFIQDLDYKDWAFAGTFLCNSWVGMEVGDPELKLWGSERDISVGAEKISTMLMRWCFNTILLNSFLMTDETMSKYAERWNRFRPKIVGAYTSSIFEFARYIKRSGVEMFRPASIICAAETLTEDVRRFIEQVFDCPALNQYGSREVGVLACECLRKNGLHTFPMNNKIEILDENLKPCPPAEIGNIYVTTLNNYSMPLVRYNIGDMAVPAQNERCSCGRGFPLIENVTGRHIEVFTTREGRVVPGEFFIHFIGVLYNKNYIRQFQVIQKDYDYILIRLVVIDNQKFNESKADIINSIKKVMGKDCKVEFDYVDEIPRTASGKYLYTISEVGEFNCRQEI